MKIWTQKSTKNLYLTIYIFIIITIFTYIVSQKKKSLHVDRYNLLRQRERKRHNVTTKVGVIYGGPT